MPFNLSYGCSIITTELVITEQQTERWSRDRMLLSVINPRPDKPGEAGLFCNKTDRNCRLLLDNYRLVWLTSDGKFDNNHSHISIIAAGRRFIDRRGGGTSTRYTCRVPSAGSDICDQPLERIRGETHETCRQSGETPLAPLRRRQKAGQ